MRTSEVTRRAVSTLRRTGTVGMSVAAITVALALPGFAQQARTVTVSVPTGPLEKALLTFGRQAGLRLIFPTQLTKGRSTPGIAGNVTPENAVAALLAGTGLTYRFTAPGSVTIDAVGPAAAYSQAGSTISLDTIEVQGETATGPVTGYIARRSASGSKTDTPLIETPQSVSIVTRDQIAATSARSIADTLNYTPGVVAQAPIFARMVDDFNVRGFNVANGNLGTLRDGLKLQSNVYDGGQEPYGLERVEVLKGAASVLYGQLGPGGVINAISKRPTLNPMREINVEYGSYNRRQVSADLSGPLTPDGQFSYRLTGLLRKSETSIDHVVDDKIYIAPALTWAPTTATSLTLLGYYQQIKTQFAPPMPFANTRNGQIPRNLFIGQPGYDRYDGDQYAAGYLFEHNFTDSLKLRHNLRYFAADVTWDYLTFGGLQANGRTLNRGVSDRDEKSTGFTTDTSLEAKFDTGPLSHTVVGGLDTYRRTYESHRRGGTVAALANIYDPVYNAIPTIGTLDNGSDTVGKQYGIYLQDQIKYDRWVLLLGGRHDWAESKVRAFSTNRVTEQNDSAFTGRAGLVYLFDNGLAPYASYSQSFQPQAGTSRLGEAFKPTEGEQYEVGIRYQPTGSNILLSAAVYDLTQKNALTSDPVAPLAFQVQTGEVRSRGFELEAKGKFDALSVIAAYSYNDARVTKSNDVTTQGQRVDLTPYHTIAIWADYELAGIGLRGLKLGGGMRYLSSTNLTGLAFDAPGRFLVDAAISYDFEAVSPHLKGMALQVSAKNLLDKNYITCSGANGCRYGDPRTVTAALSYRW